MPRSLEGQGVHQTGADHTSGESLRSPLLRRCDCRNYLLCACSNCALWFFVFFTDSRCIIMHYIGATKMPCVEGMERQENKLWLWLHGGITRDFSFLLVHFHFRHVSNTCTRVTFSYKPKNQPRVDWVAQRGYWRSHDWKSRVEGGSTRSSRHVLECDVIFLFF